MSRGFATAGLTARNRKNNEVSPVQLLLSAALETWCHQLLYVRRIYPKESFCNTYFLGIRCKANRHPGVVSYISNAIDVAVPALIGPNRIADEISLEVVDRKREVRNKQIKQHPLIKSAGQRAALPERKFSSSLSPSQPQLQNSGLRQQQTSSSSPSSDPESSSKKRSIDDLSYLPFQQEEEEGLTQNSASSLSTAAQLQQNNDERKYKSESFSMTLTDTSGDGLEHQKASSNQNYQETILEPKSVEVLERFSLSFSSSLEKRNIIERNQTDTQGNGTSHKAKKSSRTNLFQNTTRQSNTVGTMKSRQDGDASSVLLAELEKGFRNLILNLSSLKRDRVPPSDGLAFKVVLRVDDGQKVCPEIQRAFEAGSWFPSSAETAAAIAERRPGMPLYQVAVDDCDICFKMHRLAQTNNTSEVGD